MIMLSPSQGGPGANARVRGPMFPYVRLDMRD